ncbi:conserved hypothetical protein [Hyphomicrobiales bacterium]|nr:conserved hypothetical protein [Hyphomicrobiales bacterium]CAH1702877.1 hypothetical protein BOSEA1005_30749 [Hyphomicrobiales bacterium]CAI0347064.1 conserved hypothetical protein [Hyphomicrobiales bacterium]
MSDPVGRRMWLHYVLSPIQVISIAVTGALAYFANYPVPALIAFTFLAIDVFLPTKIRAEDYGETSMVPSGDIKAFKKASKRSDEGSKLSVKLVKSSWQIKCSREFLEIEKLGFIWLVTPKTYWIQNGFSVTRGDTAKIEMETVFRDVGREKPRWKSEIVGQTWHHATKNGDRDYRFKNNYQIPIVRDWIAVVHLPTRETMEFVCRSEAEAEAICDHFRIVFAGRQFSPKELESIGGWLRVDKPSLSEKIIAAATQSAAAPAPVPVALMSPQEKESEPEAMPTPPAPVRSDNPLRPTWQQFAARQPE